MDNSNVIPFPRAFISRPETITKEEVDDSIRDVQLYHITEAINTIAPIVFGNLELAGFDVPSDNRDEIKDGAFIVEAIRSVMCRHYGIYHPFQKVLDNLLIKDPTDEDALIIADNINLDLKKCKEENEAEVTCEAN